VVAVFWVVTWLLGQPVREAATGLAAAAVAVPTYLVAARASARRVHAGVDRAVPPPRASVHETQANSRDRRMRLAGVVLTGIVALLIFDHFTDGGGVMAGLLAGLLGALGTADWQEARIWDEAERQRESRLYVLIRPDALTPRLGATDVFETPRPSRRREHAFEPSPFDLGI
jgi:hypothetical protein